MRRIVNEKEKTVVAACGNAHVGTALACAVERSSTALSLLAVRGMRQVMRSIIALREHRLESPTQTCSEAHDCRWTLVGAGPGAARLRCGLRRVPLSRRHESPALRTNHGHQL